MVGETAISTDPKELEKELDKYFQDANLPFDQTVLKVDPAPLLSPEVVEADQRLQRIRPRQEGAEA